MKITMARGDKDSIGFVVRDPNGEPLDFSLDEIFFTVKKRAEDRNALMQKRLTSGTIQPDGEGGYTFTIEPEDTNGLAFGNYVFDIEVIADSVTPGIKKTFTGDLEITPEVTHACNEGG